MKSKRILIICGGQSGEHEVSLTSAYFVSQALKEAGYQVSAMGITHEGRWHYAEDGTYHLGEPRADKIKLNTDLPVATLLPWSEDNKAIVMNLESNSIQHFDCLFPILHGPYGEDGTIQGFFEMLQVPFVGSGCLSSALCMDKIVSKSMSHEYGVPVTEFVVTHKSELSQEQAHKVKSFDFPVFVKPNVMGSSVGVTQVYKEEDLKEAIEVALKYDTQCLIEKKISGRELECAIIGENAETLECSEPGEVRVNPAYDFYTYEVKYTADDGYEIDLPAKLPTETLEAAKDIAKKSYLLHRCSGFARIDMFLEDKTHKIYLNEVNTIPGCTGLSIFPMLFKSMGLNYTEFLDQVITIAEEKHERKSHLSLKKIT